MQETSMIDKDVKTIETVKRMIEHGHISQEIAEMYFPELKESNEDRVRNSLIEFLNQFYSLGIHGNYDCWEKADCSEWIAWLEKQKPAWSEEDEKIIDGLISICDEAQDNIPRLSVRFSHVEALKKWLKSLKDRVQPQPKQEWSEEDEKTIVKMRDFFIRVLGDKPDFTEDKRYEEFIEFIDNRLASLRPQSKWKPSKEQMHILKVHVDSAKNGYKNADILESLYNDLKNLTE